MAPEPAFEDLMTRLRQGDEDAAKLVCQRFSSRLIALASRQLGPQMRQKLDPEDVLQSVFRSFFWRQAEGQVQAQSWDGLWSLLTIITLRKCGYRVRHFRAECRDLERETVPQPPSDESHSSWQAMAREPTPSEAAMLQETVEQLLRGLDARDRQIVELSLQGYSVAEVSDQVGCTERTVQRLLARVKKRLERLGAEDGI